MSGGKCLSGNWIYFQILLVLIYIPNMPQKQLYKGKAPKSQKKDTRAKVIRHNQKRSVREGKSPSYSFKSVLVFGIFACGIHLR